MCSHSCWCWHTESAHTHTLNTSKHDSIHTYNEYIWNWINYPHCYRPGSISVANSALAHLSTGLHAIYYVNRRLCPSPHAQQMRVSGTVWTLLEWDNFATITLRLSSTHNNYVHVFYQTKRHLSHHQHHRHHHHHWQMLAQQPQTYALDQRPTSK